MGVLKLVPLPTVASLAAYQPVALRAQTPNSPKASAGLLVQLTVMLLPTAYLPVGALTVRVGGVTAKEPFCVAKLTQVPLPTVARQATIAW
jgi:hypothetical protein